MDRELYEALEESRDRMTEADWATAWDVFLGTLKPGDAPDEVLRDEDRAWDWLKRAFQVWWLETQLAELAKKGLTASVHLPGPGGKLQRQWRTRKPATSG